MKTKIIKQGFLAAMLALVVAHAAYALDSFVVRDIQVVGLHRIQLGTVLNYVPINVGQTLQQSDTSRIITALYGTGFFTNVSLARHGNALVIHVVERPTIGLITLSGNKEIKSESLNRVMKDIGLVQGQVFNNAILERLSQELKVQYNNRGRYNAEVRTKVNPLSQNRVRIDVSISEGHVAKIREIHIIGNVTYPEKLLLKQFLLTPSNLMTLLSSRDQYSKEKLDASLEALKSFYMDRGFIKMEIDSTQVSLTPNHRDVYITVRITENARYHFSGFKLAGKFVVPKESLDRLVPIHKGDIFSRSAVGRAVNDIGTMIGDAGYGFPKINPIPVIDDAAHTVFVTIYLDPGMRAYIRRINFSGNHKTADYVLRHNIKQKEAALLSISDIKESERRLRNLQYFKNVAVKTAPAPGTNNQVDLDFEVTEIASTTINASVGYGTLGFEFNTGINEPNFLGTGRTVGFNFSRRADLQNYALNYYDPFIDEGIGQGFNVYYQKYTPGRNTDVASYTSNRFGGDVNFTVATSDYQSWNFGVGFSHMEINAVNAATPQYTAFLNRYGMLYNQMNLSTGWQFNSFDQVIFPNSGYRQSLSFRVSVPADNHALNYFKAAYTGRLYIPLVYGFNMSLRSGLGYGRGFGNTMGLPFYENYYGGGIGGQGQVRGYDNFSLGPRDTGPQTNPIGGNAVVTGSAELALPYPISRESLRTSLFFDAGNVYNWEAGKVPASFLGTSSGPIRMSAGLALEWQSPFGPLQFALAHALNPQPGDRKTPFHFTISTGM